MSNEATRPSGVIERLEHYIDGAFVPASPDGGVLEVHDSGTGELMGRVPAGTREEAERAILAARRAFDEGPWPEYTVAQRVALLEELAAAIAARVDDLAQLMAREVGMPVQLAKAVQAGLPQRVMQSYVDILRDYEFEEEIGHSLVVREPIGVVACITPWNYPLHQIVAKVAPALAAGCTVVVKPSEIAPLNAYALAEIVDASSLPKGVFNLVSGTGPVVGEVLASHPGVDMVSFTGSTRAGRRVTALAAETIKRVTTELGGKSANVLLDDLDDAAFAHAVASGVRGCYLNSGQTCSAQTRMLVPRSRAEAAKKIAKEAAESLTTGDPFADDTRVGPLVSSLQRDRVRGYIQKGIDEGATLVTGGLDAPEGAPEGGYFVRPTVFADVTTDMTIAREEIFGPVLSILFYDDEDEAVRIANDSDYGLSGGVWAADADRAMRVARRLRTGRVDINGAGFNHLAPFGGYKQSGNGREMGRHGLEEYLEIKSLQR